MNNMPFIGRSEELEKIENSITAWGSKKYIFIKGRGGIGKTRLLQELLFNQKRHQDTETPFVVTEILDFGDQHFRTPLNVGLKTIEMINRQVEDDPFNSYLATVVDFYKLMEAEASPQTLNRQQTNSYKEFVKNFNRLSSRYRVVMFRDTVDAVNDSLFWDYILSIEEGLLNCIILYAGREKEIDDIVSVFETKNFSTQYDVITLNKLDQVEAADYLEKKCSNHAITKLDPVDEKKILLISQGRPILLDLAIDWYLRPTLDDDTLDWLRKSKLSELETILSSNSGVEKIEKHLVRYLKNPRRDVDQLTVVLSHVYPLDESIISLLLNESQDRSRDIVRESRMQSFIKTLPDGKITLHDEMRRFVQKYVLEDIDADGFMRKSQSEIAIEYFNRLINNLENDVETKREEEEVAKNAENFKEQLDTFLTRSSYQQELVSCQLHLLNHQLIAENSKAAFKLFCKLFDQASKYFYLRGDIINIIDVHIDKFTTEQLIEFKLRKIRYLMDVARFEDALNIMSELQNQPLNQEQEIDFMIKDANIRIRFGEYYKGIEILDSITHKHPDLPPKQMARIYNELGWAHRLVANFTSANIYYHKGLKLAIKTNNTHLQALVYNNLAFVNAYDVSKPRNFKTAIWYSNQASRIWKEENNQRELGRVYSTRGCIYFMAGQNEHAKTNFDKALNIFSDQDYEWLSLIYSWYGALCIASNEFELAEKYLQTSLNYNIQKDVPMTLSRLAQLYMSQGKIKQAEECVVKCRKLSFSLPDRWYQLVSLRDLTRLSVRKKDYTQLKNFESELDKFLSRGQTEDRRALGMTYLNLGRMGLALRNFDKSEEYLFMGLSLLAELGSYANNDPQDYVDRLQNFMRSDIKLTPEEIREIGRRMYLRWQKTRMDEKFSDYDLVFFQWSEWS